MKNALSRTLVDPRLADAEVIPTSTMQLPQQEPIVPTQDLVNDALSHRAELAEARINLANTEISNKAVRSSLLADVSTCSPTTEDRASEETWPCPLVPLPAALSRACFDPARAAPPFRNGGPVSYGSALNQLVDSSAPDKGVGLSSEHSAAQPGGPGNADSFRTGISPGADASAADGKPDSH